MHTLLAFSVVFALATLVGSTANAAAGASAKAAAPETPCDRVAAILSGLWKNELGSAMRLAALPDGTIGGGYNSAKGRATGWYTLAGRFTCSEGAAPTVALAVSWQRAVNTSSDSSTVWTGQLLPGRVLETTWLLSRATTPAEAWSSTMVGKDTFRPGSTPTPTGSTPTPTA